MLSMLLLLLVLVTACVAIHAVGMYLALRWVARKRVHAKESFRLSEMVWILARVVYGLLVLHLLQISVWAACYRMSNCFGDMHTAFYFSATSYSTVGYGDVIPQGDGRMLGAIEGVTGILMFGWSTGVLFTVVLRMMDRFKDFHAPPGPEA